MNYNEFKDYVKENIKSFLPQDFASARVDIHDVIKNNDTHLSSVTIIKQNEHIAPNIYLEKYYNDYNKGRNIESIMNEIAQVRVKNSVAINDVDKFFDINNIKNNITAQLVNYETNKQRFQYIPYTRIGDLAIVYRIKVPQFTTELQEASCIISNDFQKRYDISTEELHSIALKNTPELYPARFESLSEILYGENLEEVSQESADLGMYILSNDARTDGAIALLYPGMLNNIGKLLNNNFYVIPSSIHETIIVKDNKLISPEALNNMVKIVNLESLKKEEVLSEHVYEYDFDNKILYNAEDKSVVFSCQDNEEEFKPSPLLNNLFKHEQGIDNFDIEPDVNM